MRRSGHFYSKNEKETLKKLGLKPAPQSGAGWIVKEDGENEEIMVQLKSTDSSSYRIDMLDIKKLEYHASVSNKLPIFLIQFLKQDKIYCLLEVNELLSVKSLNKIKSLIKQDSNNKTKYSIRQEREMYKEKEFAEVNKKIIKSSKTARNEFFEEREKKNGRKK